MIVKEESLSSELQVPLQADCESKIIKYGISDKMSQDTMDKVESMDGGLEPPAIVPQAVHTTNKFSDINDINWILRGEASDEGGRSKESGREPVAGGGGRYHPRP